MKSDFLNNLFLNSITLMYVCDYSVNTSYKF